MNRSETKSDTYMAKVKDVMHKVVIVKLEMSFILMRCPMFNRVLELKFRMMEAMILFMHSDWFDMRDVTVITNVFPIDKVHWCWAFLHMSARTVSSRWSVTWFKIIMIMVL